MKLLRALFTICLLANYNSILAEDTEEQLIHLEDFEKKIYSQNGEDGVIIKLIETLGTDSKYYVEFGVQGGEQCNTRYLREHMGWKGLMMDMDFSNPSIGLEKEVVTAENINNLFAKYHVPENLDLLSIDIDYNDFHVWHAIDSKYAPRIVVIEFNGTHLPNEDKVVPYNPRKYWDRCNYFGASILALYNLAKEKGYSLVYVENKGVNLFFVRSDILKNCPYSFPNVNRVKKLYKKPKYGGGPNGGHGPDDKNRPYTTSTKLIERKHLKERIHNSRNT